jgi:hypothetical protein
MADTQPTLAETRQALQKQLNELDLDRAKKVKAIFERSAMKTATADLKALFDDSDRTALHRSTMSDVNALIGNLILPLEQAMPQIEQHIQKLEAALAPPQEPQAPIPAPPGTP